MPNQSSQSPSIIKPPLLGQSSNQRQSKCNKILNKLDLFSYVPSPQAYPVSTKKSKIGSLVFLIIIISYLTYDFVKFITTNTPLVSSHQVNIPQNYLYTAPDIAFGFMYGQNLNTTLNDNSYFSYQFYTIYTYTSNTTNQTTQKRVPLKLINNCQPQWLGEYSKAYQNLTCVNASLKLMNVITQNSNTILQRLFITACQPNQNITCQNATTLSQMTSGGRFYLLINLPAGFDYNTGTVDQSQSSVQIYQFFLVPGIYTRINIDYYPFQITTSPTYFTSWTYKNYNYMQSYEPVIHTSNVSIYNPNILMSITFDLHSSLQKVQVKYETFIQRVSSWGALASLIMTIFGICCLTHNKSKFQKKNPSWKNFDEALKKKQNKIMQLELQNISIQNGKQVQVQIEKDNISVEIQHTQVEEEQQDIGGLAAIRKRLQNQKKL